MYKFNFGQCCFLGFIPSQEWKDGTAPLGRLTPKYKPTPEDDTPVEAEEPSLGICVKHDGALAIPPEIRSRYLQDPHRASEWKKLLREFDRKWASAEGTVQTTASSPTPATEPASTQPADDGQGDGCSSGSWSDVFPGEPTNKAALHQKYGAGCHTFSLDNNVTAVITEGPRLFVTSSGASHLKKDSPILAFGAGTWLLDSKADAYLQAWNLSNKSQVQIQPR